MQEWCLHQFPLFLHLIPATGLDKQSNILPDTEFIWKSVIMCYACEHNNAVGMQGNYFFPSIQTFKRPVEVIWSAGAGKENDPNGTNCPMRKRGWLCAGEEAVERVSCCLEQKGAATLEARRRWTVIGHHIANPPSGGLGLESSSPGWQLKSVYSILPHLLHVCWFGLSYNGMCNKPCESIDIPPYELKVFFPLNNQWLVFLEKRSDLLLEE